MAEEEKMTFTFLDDDGNPIVDESKEEGQEEGQDDESQENTTSNEDEGQESEDESEESSEDAEGEAESGSEDEGDSQDDGVDEDEEADEEEEEEEEAQDDAQEEAQDVIDYDELPEAIQKALDFMEDTGGSLEDFLRVNQDFSKLSQDEVIRQHLSKLYPSLDGEDIDYEMTRLFGINEDEDSEADIRRKTVEKKKFYGTALKELQSGSEKYKADLVSGSVLPAEAKEALEFKKNYEAQQGASSKQLEQARSSFVKETNKVFNKNFKGFEVKVGDETILYKPENVNKLKEQNLDVNNLLGKFLNKDGSVSDVSGYHRALAVASDPEGYAQHFFELGKAALAEEEAADSRNTNVGKNTRGVQPKRKDPKAPKFRFLDEEAPQQTGKIKLRHY
jgi:hypothetical protein